MPRNIFQGILALPFSYRQNKLSKVRPLLSEDDFVRQISDAGGDREAASVVYNRLIDWIYVEGFTPYPEDSLTKIYGMAEEELDEDLIIELINSLNIPHPTENQLVEFGSVDTPLRVAQLVSLAREHVIAKG